MVRNVIGELTSGQNSFVSSCFDVSPLPPSLYPSPQVQSNASYKNRKLNKAGLKTKINISMVQKWNRKVKLGKPQGIQSAGRQAVTVIQLWQERD